MFIYRAFGLCFHSEIELPMARGSGPADVLVRCSDLASVVAGLEVQNRVSIISIDRADLLYRGHACFRVENGKEILVDALSGPVDKAVTLAVLGPAMAALLQQRGYLLLHASAVALEGGAIAFLGSSGWGKSTLAAAFHARGFPLVSDDIVALQVCEDEIRVYPGFPQFKLWPDALAAVGHDPEQFPRVFDELEKRARRIDEGFSAAPLALRRIFVLGVGDAIESEPLAMQDAFFQIAGHSFGIGWLHGVSGGAFFQQRALLAQHVPVRLLRRPRDLSLLAHVVDCVLDDVGATSMDGSRYLHGF